MFWRHRADTKPICHHHMTNTSPVQSLWQYMYVWPMYRQHLGSMQWIGWVILFSLAFSMKSYTLVFPSQKTSIDFDLEMFCVSNTVLSGISYQSYQYVPWTAKKTVASGTMFTAYLSIILLWSDIWNVPYINIRNISYITSHLFFTGSLELTNDQLPTSVAS